jgi:hypothetical protein
LLQDAYPAADNAIKRRAADTVAANVLGDTLRARADARGRGRSGYGTNFNLPRR